MESVILRICTDFSGIRWQFYKSGSCNTVFTTILDEEVCVLKKPHTSAEDLMNDMSYPERFKRKSLEINPGFHCQVYPGYNVRIETSKEAIEILDLTVHIHMPLDQIIATYRGADTRVRSKVLHGRLDAVIYAQLLQQVISPRPHLHTSMVYLILDTLRLDRPSIIMPFIGSELPTDQQIAAKVLEVYIRTKNIILDACIPGNMLLFQDEIICIDLDFAIQRESLVSKEYLDEPSNMSAYEPFWDDYLDKGINTDSVEMIRTLCYLEAHIAAHEIIDIYLTPEVIHKLNICREKRIHLSRLDIESLVEMITHYPDHMAHEQSISISVLSEIQASTGHDRCQVIRDAFTRPTSPEQRMYNMWSNGLDITSVHNSLSMFGFKDAINPLQHSVQTSHSIQMHDL